MALITKPTFNSIWASTGMKQEPIPQKVNQGWLVEIPPFEYQNWITNRQDHMLAHINQAGIVYWDATVEYQAGKSYVQGADGVIYRAVTTHTNANPISDLQGNWAVAFEAAGSALLRAQNLADVPDKAAARANLGITSTVEYDTRYLIKSQNLADILNKPSARANLDVYSKQEVIDLINTLQPAGEVAAFASATAPAGWLVCDGAIISRETYPRLFAAIGTRFGAGDGSTTFRLPDLRGEFIRGWDGGRGVDTGRALGSVQSSQNLLHSHAGSASANGEHSHRMNSFGYGNSPPRFGSGGGNYYGDVVTTPAGLHTHALEITSSGGNESRPRNIALLYCIRT